MTDTSISATTAATPDEELAALVAQVAALSKTALELTKNCIDIHHTIIDTIPRVVASQVAAALAAAAVVPAGDFVQGIALTPDQLDAQFPPGTGDTQTWHVVCIGREPGLYASAFVSFVSSTLTLLSHSISDLATDQVRGIPNQLRQKKSSRQEALNFYRYKHQAGLVQKWNEVTPAPASAAAAPVANSQ
ncbi:hypothetical protein DFH09DRAFT_1110460 [Mycena vulgaris]|nr:hypothetical protein DFH09DRAFT_1110460 [Mycena vulgaris]